MAYDTVEVRAPEQLAWSGAQGSTTGRYGR